MIFQSYFIAKTHIANGYATSALSYLSLMQKKSPCCAYHYVTEAKP